MQRESKQSEDPREAFCNACDQGDESAAIALLKKYGLDPLYGGPLDGDEDPPLHLAAYWGSIALFEELVAAGKISHAVLDWSLSGNLQRRVPCVLCCTAASQPSSPTRLTPVLEPGADVCELTDDGRNLLHACRNVDLLPRILAAGVDLEQRELWGASGGAQPHCCTRLCRLTLPR